MRARDIHRALPLRRRHTTQSNDDVARQHAAADERLAIAPHRSDQNVCPNSARCQSCFADILDRYRALASSIIVVFRSSNFAKSEPGAALAPFAPADAGVPVSSAEKKSRMPRKATISAPITATKKYMFVDGLPEMRKSERLKKWDGEVNEGKLKSGNS